MPIYEYRCESCGAELEKIQKFSDPALTRCPECGEERLVKLVSASAFRLKGSGWYETDFKNSGTKRNLAADSGSGGGASDKGGKEASGSPSDSDNKSGNKSGEGKTDKGSASSGASAA